MLQEPRFLSAEQFLLTTLIVKLAIMAVLATMLARVDGLRANAHLENSNPCNLRLYEREGFSVTAEIKARKDAPPVFAMWRPRRDQGSRTISQ